MSVVGGRRARRWHRPLVVALALVGVAIPLGRLVPHREATPAPAARTVSAPITLAGTARAEPPLLARARRVALAYAQLDPRREAATLRELSRLVTPALRRRLHALLRQDTGGRAAVPPPTARITSARLVRTGAATQDALVVLRRRQAGLVTRELLVIRLRTRNGLAIAIAAG